MVRLLRPALLCAAVLSLPVAACSSGEPVQPSIDTISVTGEPAAPHAAGVSPGGVTTQVDVPAAATESQYGQACLAAKRWFDERGGDPRTLVEDYLKTVQAAGFVGPATFDARWAELTPGQQAGAIMAATGAADGQCG